jgi:hypothetical protein
MKIARENILAGAKEQSPSTASIADRESSPISTIARRPEDVKFFQQAEDGLTATVSEKTVRSSLRHCMKLIFVGSC